jgi:hypothetical protein
MYRGYDRKNGNSDNPLDPVARRAVQSKKDILSNNDTSDACTG